MTLLSLAAKSQLHRIDDDSVFLVRRPPKPLNTGHSTPFHCPTPTHLRPDVDAPLGATLLSRYHLLPPESFEHGQHARANLLVDRYGHLRPLVDPTLPQVPGTQDFASVRLSSPYPCPTAQASPSAPTTSGHRSLHHAATPTSFSSPTASAAVPSCTRW